MTIRFLAGGMIDDIRVNGSVDRSYCYRVVKAVMRAIVAIPSLQIWFPTSPTEREQGTAAFAARSNERVVNGCVAAMYG
ncbi:hypothetical protein PR003_g5859 [Phytophthora rubi]|uniref:Uncharacterized protein n=1 Tax=Phytophthora rubi TaxID=129364 RepID=A0A6A4FID3_9STRA|nr:hypothetical protein PR003_g5859 [Phytophthora rubi]